MKKINFIYILFIFVSCNNQETTGEENNDTTLNGQWILNPQRLPIPPRRPFVSKEGAVFGSGSILASLEPFKGDFESDRLVILLSKA